MANALTIEEKHKLCLKKEEDPDMPSKDLVAFCRKNFGKDPSKSQISRILQAAKEGKRWNISGDDGKVVKRIRAAKWPELEKSLDIWIMQKQQQKVELREEQIMAKASALAAALNAKDFGATHGWFQKFLQRYGYKSFKLHRESNVADIADVEQARKELPQIIEDDVVEEFTDNLRAPISLKEAQHAGDALARFMQQEPATFSAEKLFRFERQINGEIKKMVVSSFHSRKQQPISDFQKTV